MTPPLYEASVPVFLHYLGRADALLKKAQGREDLMQARLAPDMMTCARQFASAAGFTLRGACALADCDIPDFPISEMNHAGVRERLVFAQEKLKRLTPADFDGAETRIVRHRAGFAELEQTGAEFLHLFAMPNFFFHLGMGFAILRQGGLDIGKSDFDALHDYPQGFAS